jgi:hypothetical protein
MRTFGAGFASKLAGDSYLPVLFCKYELVTYVSGPVPGSGTQATTVFYWSEREITYDGDTYEGRIVNTSPLEQTLEADNQSFGSMGLQISNYPSNLAGAIQAGMKCTVYLGFEDSVGAGTVTDAEVMFIGTVEGDIEITEDSVSFGLQDIAHTYDRQVPELIGRGEYPFADPDAIGDTKPIIMGRVRDHICRPVASGFASVLSVEGISGNNYVYVGDDIGWWISAHDPMGGNNPQYNDPIIINTIEESDEIYSYAEETLYISSIEFDVSENKWKIIFTTNLVYDHKSGDTIYIDDLCATTSEGYAYLVADHPVESITNVKVDGLPPAQVYAYPNLSPSDPVCLDWNLPLGKAYIVVMTNPGGVGRQGASGMGIQDTIAVNDTIDVDDSIGVKEPGHDHDTGAAQVFQYSIEIDWKYFRAGAGRVYIAIKSGGFSQVILDTSTGANVKGPYAFNSTSNSVTIDYIAGAASINQGFARFDYINVKAIRTDASGGTSYTITSITNEAQVQGVIRVTFPPAIGGALTSTSLADVAKTGEAKKVGAATKSGTIKLIGGNSAADVLIGNTVTCDVIGICDGSSGFVKAHNQIEKFINKYAQNPINGITGSANVVAYQNELDADDYYDTLYNTDSASNTATNFYPNLNKISAGSVNPSPNALINTFAATQSEGCHALDFAITEPNRFRDILGDMLYQANATLHWRNGVAQIKYIADDPAQDDEIDSSDIIMKTMSLARSRASDLATDIEVRYDYNTQKDYQGRYEYAFVSGRGDLYTKTKLDATRRVGTYSRERVYDLTMIRDQVAAEIVSKRIYDKYSAPKFESSISTVLKNLAIEPGDFVTMETPIYSNGVLDRGLVTRRTLEFGSAIDKRPDLIHLTVQENHTGDGFYLRPNTLSDSIAISDAAPTLTLNDVNTKFQTLTDSITISEQINVNPGVLLTDSVGLTEALAFEYEMHLTESVAIDDNQLRFTGILFWDVPLAETISIDDTTSFSVALVDSVYEDGVFVKTDLTTVGVFQ